MSTWEERMSVQARAEAERVADDPHRDHHSHLDGAGVYCSCGEFAGVTCVVFPEDWTPERQAALRCGICGAPGMVDLKG